MLRLFAFLLIVSACNNSVENEPLPIIEPTKEGGVRTIVNTEEFDSQEAYQLYQEGLKLIRRDEYGAAKIKYQQALAIEPKNEVILNSLGIADMRLYKFDSSEASFKKAIQINPTYFIAMNNLGLLYYYYGKYEKGLAILKEVPIEKLGKISKGANFNHQFMNYTGLAQCDSAQRYYHLAKKYAFDELYLESIKEFMQDELVLKCPEFVLNE